MELSPSKVQFFLTQNLFARILEFILQSLTRALIRFRDTAFQVRSLITQPADHLLKFRYFYLFQLMGLPDLTRSPLI